MSFREFSQWLPIAFSSYSCFLVHTVSSGQLSDRLRTCQYHRPFENTGRSNFFLALSLWDIFVIGCIYKTAVYVDALVDPAQLSLPHPLLYSFARFAIWSLYGFFAGLFATGLWVIAHECGHQAFSESKLINNTVGWVLHSA